ncbi:MAG: hydrolase [Candidatus Saccharibacteria bacterium]
MEETKTAEGTPVAAVCCPVFDTTLWDGKTHVWQDKLFMQNDVFQVMHIPVNMGSVITRMCKKIEEAGAMPDPKDFLMLCYDPSSWKSEINMTVTKDVPGGKMVKLTGTFISRVFDGPYNHVPKWIKEMDQYLASQGKKAMKYYFHYAYCPKCSKKYGHNYCAAFAQVA